MKIYIDSDYRCFVSPASGRIQVETDFFEGKCDAYMEGYRFVPAGKTWTRSDGAVFHGEMAAPWRPWRELDDAQRAYEQKRLASLREENAALLDDMARMVDEVYQSDLEMMGV